MRARSRCGRLLLAGLAAGATAVASVPAGAQLGKLAAQGSGSTGGNNNAPVTFQADQVSYDRDRGLITATGHVVAWQNGDVLKADKVTFDRNTNVAAAYGQVSIVQPDGEVLFAHYAELTQGMKQGVLEGMRALLQQNGRLAANGARRYEGKVNDLSRAVYTACDVCAKHPDELPFWQLRAYGATQDLEHKRIEYQDMFVDLLGVPVFYFPYFSMADPSVKRQSGFLVPDIAANDDYLGPFVTLPYYRVLGPSSDVTLTPLIASKSGPQLTTEYRRDFNNGIVRVTGAVAYDSSSRTDGSSATPMAGQRLDSLEGYLFANANFVYNDHWDYGASVNLASSSNYLRDYRVPGYGSQVLGNSVYLEGYGTGAYSRVDALAYEGVNQYGVVASNLPFVLPRYQYDLLLPTDPLGGHLRVSTQDFGIYRSSGTTDQRAGLVLDWNRNATGPLGTQWTLTGNLQSEVYNATLLDEAPTVLPGINHAVSQQAMPTAALKVSWPLIRLDRGGGLFGGTQLVEPIVQLIAAGNPARSTNDHLVNEDSLDYEFGPDTLFLINRFSGIDLQDGGERVNVGIHGNWTFPNGMYVDGVTGESFRSHIDDRATLPEQGLERHASDIVSGFSFVPSALFNLTSRFRYDHDQNRISFADATGTTGVRLLHVSAGFLHAINTPYYFFDGDWRVPSQISPGFFLPRDEVTGSVASSFGHWDLSTFAQRNLTNEQYSGYTNTTFHPKWVAIGADVAWHNECFIANVNYSKRYTFINGDNGDQTILFTLTFKTLGAFGFNG